MVIFPNIIVSRIPQTNHRIINQSFIACCPPIPYISIYFVCSQAPLLQRIIIKQAALALGVLYIIPIPSLFHPIPQGLSKIVRKIPFTSHDYQASFFTIGIIGCHIHRVLFPVRWCSSHRKHLGNISYMSYDPRCFKYVKVLYSQLLILKTLVKVMNQPSFITFIHLHVKLDG